MCFFFLELICFLCIVVFFGIKIICCQFVFKTTFYTNYFIYFHKGSCSLNNLLVGGKSLKKSRGTLLQTAFPQPLSNKPGTEGLVGVKLVVVSRCIKCFVSPQIFKYNFWTIRQSRC